MQVDPSPIIQTSALQSALQKALPLALSFLDDALILAASNLGLHLPWLQCLGTVLLTVSLLYWAFRVVRFCYKRYTASRV
ncbi:MAG TPA: hypothetical protein V6D06_03370 [Trichocoleus sp.]